MVHSAKTTIDKTHKKGKTKHNDDGCHTRQQKHDSPIQGVGAETRQWKIPLLTTELVRAFEAFEPHFCAPQWQKIGQWDSSFGTDVTVCLNWDDSPLNGWWEWNGHEDRWTVNSFDGVATWRRCGGCATSKKNSRNEDVAAVQQVKEEQQKQRHCSCATSKRRTADESETGRQWTPWRSGRLMIDGLDSQWKMGRQPC